VLDVVLDELAAARDGEDPAEPDDADGDGHPGVPAGPVRGLLRRPGTGRPPTGPAPDPGPEPAGHVEDDLVF
jgi:DEAD/DEAH box helicase domain-containing protein